MNNFNRTIIIKQVSNYLHNLKMISNKNNLPPSISDSTYHNSDSAC